MTTACAGRTWREVRFFSGLVESVYWEEWVVKIGTNDWGHEYWLDCIA
jgi:hypothetical protein